MNPSRTGGHSKGDNEVYYRGRRKVITGMISARWSGGNLSGKRE
jgi:hypothetical protein